LQLFFCTTQSYAEEKKEAVDLNSASLKELTSIKGIGKAVSKKIIAGRPYVTVDDLSKIGLSESKIALIKPFVKVWQSATPAAQDKTASPSNSKDSLKKMINKTIP
jgi:predicted DNA-binding helix-hairpin-helix protein